MKDDTENCDRTRVESLTSDFFTLWSSKNEAGLLRLFASTFQLQDGLPEGRAVIHTADDLRRYLESRFALGDTFTPTRIEIPAKPSATQANATVAFRRAFAGRILDGNAKLVCKSGVLPDVVMTAE